MSYDQSLERNYVYGGETNSSLVNGTPDYSTLGNYFANAHCPKQSVAGQCLVNPVLIVPSFGGTSYCLPGFNSNMDSSPLSDSNYFNIQNAYPQYCKTNLVNNNYS